MATGTTLTVSLDQASDYKAAVAATDAGTPTAGTIEVLYDDGESQEQIVRGLQAAISHIIENVTTR